MTESKRSTDSTLDEKPARGVFRFGRKSAAAKSNVGEHATSSVDEKDTTPAGATVVTQKPATPEVTPVSFTQLFRYATKSELLLNGIGLLAAAAAGAAQPLMTLLFGRLVQNFVAFEVVIENIDSGNSTAASDLPAVADAFVHAASLNASYLTYIGVGMMVCTYVYMLTWVYTAEVNAKRIREKYLYATLRQDIAYFDNVGPGEIATRIQTDTHLVQQGTSEKVALAVSYVAAFICGFILAYVRNWRLALAMSSILPCIGITGAVMNRFISRYMQMSLKFIAEAGTVAEEVISTVRTAQAFGVQQTLSVLYDTYIAKSHTVGLKSAAWNGGGLAIFFFTIYSAYALAFDFGTTLIIHGHADAGTVVNVFFAILIGSFSLALLAPEMQAITEARGAAAKLFATIDRVPEIDSYSPEGLKPEAVEGGILLENIRFSYPSRPDVEVVKGISLLFRPGKTAALVGASGSGKSTVIALIERFYDPSSGTVKLDGRDIRDLNIKWLRSQIGLVSQEPTLFATTIAENVAHGLINTDKEHLPESEKRELIKQACVMANADGFISKLPDGYDTMVGERAILLSGGQKQRIAIARAIVSNPRILLLDEATSALDTQSEGIVQDALNKASVGRTTITIAHRLSTIKEAETIFVMGEGCVVEQGTHNELLADESSAYYKLVQAQKIREADEMEAVTIAAGSDSTEEDMEKIAAEEEVPLGRKATGRSLASEILEQRQQAAEEQKKPSLFPLLFRIFSYNRDGWRRYLFGMIAAICTGAVYPCFGIVFAKSINGLSLTSDEAKRHAGDRNALWLFIIAICSTVPISMQNYSFTSSATTLTARLRSLSFRAILRQDIEYFDEEKHSTGSLVSNLSNNPQKILGLSGVTLGAKKFSCLFSIVQSLATLVTGYIIGLAFVWKIALIGIATTPLLVSAGYIRLRIVVLKDQKNKAAHEESAQLACEASGAIRTVAALTREHDCCRLYSESLEEPLRKSNRVALWSNALFAFSQAVSFFVIALVFWFGAKRVAALEYNTFQFFVGLMSTTFAAIQAGNVFTFVPDVSEAKGAAEDILEIFDSMPLVDAESTEGQVISRKTTHGQLLFKGVHFRYPSRPSVRVLRDLNLRVEPGTYVALVGASGCGKSTTIQLIERFYDPLAGKILIDGNVVSELNVSEYRKQMSLVSQEPTLYSGTIRFNILLGAIKPHSEVTQEEIEEACRDANILEFIESLPKGFDTEVGGKGSQLSGGQKQRIAIARALLRDPRILLLDEATSALDSNSEKVVQAALDKAAQGRTTIAIAHRLSTIQNADCIYFIKEGRVAESGTHDQLIAKKGDYYEFVQLQALSKKD
ncbi:multidrug resistance protein 1 [Fistulina hepatica ATCC 64428]|uniref:Multidrug resistance protein 1 n=1 Tax=Fistulina hepatica ATCC 64428 TaxID=1128425 RepID=A0A0D7A326_9AGAR|nr:multidrug resistance protein 1 [Fistulina hepatica ATCC 64428]